ncbi:MAG: sel1 repeat family protein, partial [Nitrosopumilus sp.]|nr:sel1 repeat family protein [Nitrosopumilus sp.]
FQTLTPFQYAIQEGDLVIVKKLIEQGCIPDEKQSQIIVELKREPQKLLRQPEPVKRKKPMLKYNEKLIHKIRIHANMKPEEKTKAIQKLEKQNDSLYYYDDDCFGKQFELAEATCRSEGGYNSEAEFNSKVNEILTERFRQDDESAVALLTPLSDQGNTKAQYRLANYKIYGKMTRDLKGAVELLTPLSNKGNVDAQLLLAHCKTQCNETLDFEGAIELLTPLSDDGYPDAQYLLAYCKTYGKKTKDLVGAVRLLTPLSNKSNLKAQILLAKCKIYYEETLDFVGAIKLLTPLSDQYYAPARYLLALCKIYGTTTQDLKGAVKLLSPLAKNGHKKVKAKLALLQ